MRLPARPTVADVEKLLGRADRVHDKPANILHTWDRLGILLYEPHDGRAGTLGLVYVPQGRDFDPAATYAGHVSVDGLGIDGATPLREVRTHAGPAGGTSSDSTTFKYGGVEVYVGADGLDDPVRVVEVSFYNEDEAAPTAPGGDEVERWQDALSACEAAAGGARCTTLGMRYQHGTRHVRRSDLRAALLFGKGCEKGHAFACTALGVMHANGRAVPASPAEATRLFRTACSLGDTVACALKSP
ncbi:MAG: sel1 repeat family protein [Deltaproteobacteria bacterium]|nr:sel1 repeat family protein [Deltaproteobacteria bacterium]